MDEQLRSAIDAETFDTAVQIIDDIESKRELCLDELVVKARCLQLHPSTDSRLLEGARRALLQAIERDPEYLPALIELAWFYFNVSGDNGNALSLFEKALHLAKDAAAEALVGLTRCTEEERSSTAALNTLETESAIDNAGIREEKERLRSIV